MINQIAWTEIVESGYPEESHDLSEQICFIKKDNKVYQAIWCSVSKQWLTTDCRPFYSQWKVTHWTIINKPE